MKILTYILATLISYQFVIGQGINSGLIGKVLIDSDLEYMEILNDSLIFSSINYYDDTVKYKIIDNELITIEDYTWYGPNNSKGYRIYKNKYQIEKQNTDTLILIDSEKGRLDFKNIENIKIPTIDFISIELEYLTPWDDNRLMRIDSACNYYDKRTLIPIKSNRFKKKTKVTKGKLNSIQMDSLRINLTDYLAIYLPCERGCPIDGARSNFIIKMNGQIIESKGCDLSWIHYRLLNYLLNTKIDN
jgi:hypothetical protein